MENTQGISYVAALIDKDRIWIDWNAVKKISYELRTICHKGFC